MLSGEGWIAGSVMFMYLKSEKEEQNTNKETSSEEKLECSSIYIGYADYF